jgi:hypothetical protein
MVAEWKTGNISSSHQSVNKTAMCLRQGKCIAGIFSLFLARLLAQYLTERFAKEIRCRERAIRTRPTMNLHYT